MKKRIVLVMAIVIFAMVFTSCATQRVAVRPFSASVSFPAEGTYKILGRVDYAPSQNTAGYLDFLAYAKTEHPETDDVVNILVDTEETYSTTSGPFGSSATLEKAVYMMSGIAIQYLP